MDIRNEPPHLLLGWGLLIGVVIVALALAIARRPYKPWLTSAGQFFMVWWCGVLVGHTGPGSALSLFTGLAVVFLLGDRVVKGARAMFGPPSSRA